MLLSFGDVATLAVQTLAAIFSIAVYVFLAASVFPPLFLKPRYRYSAEGDRGIRRYTFEGGRAIVYEPSVPYRKYLKQYILSANGAEKYIKCKFAPSVHKVVYDVVTFDSGDRVIETVRVREDIGYGGVSKSSMLPPRTSYAKVVIREVDEEPVNSEQLFYVPRSAVIGFTSCVTVLMVAEALLLYWVIASFANIFFAYSSFASGFGGLFAAVSAIAMGLILSGLLRYLYHFNEKIKKKKRK